MPEDPGMAVKGIVSLAVSYFPHFGCLAEIELVVDVVAIVGVH